MIETIMLAIAGFFLYCAIATNNWLPAIIVWIGLLFIYFAQHIGNLVANPGIGL